MRTKDLSRYVSRALLTLTVWLTAASPGWCEDHLMHFEAFPPNPAATQLMGDHAWTIYASGEIDADADKRLTALVAEKNIPGGSFLYFNSPGGSLLGGIKLGQTIRKHYLFTYIGQFNPASLLHPNPGYCFSACALAFLGGEYRFWTKGSIYGVHRFFWKEHTNNDADVAQILSAAVVQYINSMGVDTKLFALASEAGSSDAITPTPDELLRLNVVNNGEKPVQWSLESLPGMMYLKG